MSAQQAFRTLTQGSPNTLVWPQILPKTILSQIKQLMVHAEGQLIII